MTGKEAGCRIYQAIFGIGVRAAKITMPKRVEGVDSFFSIPDILKQEGSKRPFIVTGPHVGNSEFFQSLLHQMEVPFVVYDKVQPDPLLSQIEEMSSIYQKNQCDSFIAVGGGSNIDAAKAVSAAITRPDKRLQQLGGLLKVRHKTPLFIAVPTTAGTGSETTVAAVVTDDATHRKYAINDPVLCPDYAIIDPSLTISLPPGLTASTGMDALTHAVEAYLNTAYHKKETARLAEESVTAIMEYLPKAYALGEDIQAREEMLIASFKAGVAFTTACVGNVHAIAHTIGGLYHVPHGLANAVVLPIVLEDYGEKVYDDLAHLAKISGVSSKGSVKECAQQFIQAIFDLNKSMGIPECLDMICQEDVEQMATWAEKEANPLYPVPVVYDKKHFEKVILQVKNYHRRNDEVVVH